MIFIVFFSACAEKFSTNDFSISESIPSSWDLKLTDSSTVIGDWWESFEDSLFNDVLSDFNKIDHLLDYFEEFNDKLSKKTLNSYLKSVSNP